MEKNSKSEGENILRQKAEALLKKKMNKNVSELSEIEMQKALHELAVYQIELEMQNTELQRLKESDAEEAAEKYIALYDFAPSGFFTISKAGEIIELNFTGANMLGKERSLFKNSRFTYFLTEETKSIFNLFLESVFSNKVNKSCEVALVTNENTPIHIHLTGTLGKNGEECVVVAVDITERKKAEHELIENEAKYRTLAESSPDYIMRYDVEHRHSFMNKAALDISGYKAEDIIGKTHQEAGFDPEQSKFWEEKIDHVFKTKESVHEQFSWESTKGMVFLDWMLSPEIDDQGQVKSVLGVSRDITEIKKAEEKLSHSEERFRALIENNEGIITLIDENLKTIFRSKSNVKITGWSFEEYESINTADYIHPDDLANLKATMAEAIANPGKTFHATTRLRHKNGHYIWTEGTIKNMLHDPAVKGIITNMKDVTERKIVEEKLKEQESQLRLFIEHSPVALVMLDTDMRYLIASNKWIQDFNISNKNLKGKSHYEIFPEIPEHWKEIHRRCLAGASEKNEKELFVRADGREDWIHWEIIPWHTSTGEIGGIIIFSDDITDRVKGEEKLRESVQITKSIIDNSNSVIYLLNTRGEFIMANKRFEEVAGVSSDSFIGKTREAFFPKEISDQHRRNDLQVINAKQAMFFEEDNIEADGNHFYVTAKFPLFTADGEVYAVGGISTDITETKKAENALAESENYLRTILQTEPECVKILGLNGELLSMNPAGLAMIEADNEEQVLGHQMTELVDTKFKAAFKKLTKEVFKGNSGTLEFEITGLKGGHRWLETHVVPLKGADGKIISLLGVTRDKTEQKKADDDIKKAHVKLKELSSHLLSIREEERKRIAREIHDELGQQLTAVKMDAAWIFKKTTDTNPEIKNKLEHVISLLDGSNRSIRRILQELRPMVLDDFGLYESIKWLTQQFYENTGIKVKITGNAEGANVEEQTMLCVFRIFQESLANISRHAEAKRVTVDLSVNDSAIVLFIEDDGRGFNLNSIENTSFGILGMKERVDSLKGSFKLDSKPGKGTTIKVVLPV